MRRVGLVVVLVVAGASACGPRATSNVPVGPTLGPATEAGGGDGADLDGPDPGAFADLPDVDISKLSPRERRLFARVMREHTSPCGDPASLEVCVRESRPCKKCLPAAQYVARLVSHGNSGKATHGWLDHRFGAANVKTIAVGDSPTFGAKGAALTIVEFADFQCPHCASAQPILHSLVEDEKLKGKVMVVFKNFPLEHHERAEPAARAALAAHQQGKFWEMASQIFEHQETLADTDLEGFAKAVGLDATRFQTDFGSAAIKARVASDRALGEQVGVDSTPAVFVNGRRFIPTVHDFGGELRAWCTLDLALAQ